MKRCNCLICDLRVILIMGNNSISVYPVDASLCGLTSCPVATGLRLSHSGSELLVEGWRFSVLSGRILELSELLACKGVMGFSRFVTDHNCFCCLLTKQEVQW